MTLHTYVSPSPYWGPMAFGSLTEIVAYISLFVGSGVIAVLLIDYDVLKPTWSFIVFAVLVTIFIYLYEHSELE